MEPPTSSLTKSFFLKGGFWRYNSQANTTGEQTHHPQKNRAEFQVSIMSNQTKIKLEPFFGRDLWGSIN